MSLTVAYALLFYVATAIFVIGVGAKIVQYAKTPAPLKIPTTPAPLTKTGAARRVALEVVLFASLFKSNKWIWLLAALFHASLALVVVRHLRYFTEPVPDLILYAQPFGAYGGFAMVAGLLGLWYRRLGVERIRFISRPSDYLMLMLLVMIGLSGLTMRFVARTDIIEVKTFMLGLMYGEWHPLPSDTLLLVHLGLVALLMIVFPFSKLLHAPGVFFSPTRNQPDDAREKRHLAPWAAHMDAERDA